MPHQIVSSKIYNIYILYYYISIYHLSRIIHPFTHCTSNPFHTIDQMHQTHALCIILAIVVTCSGLHLCYKNKNNDWQEGFALSPGSFPDSSTYPILYKDYPVKTPGGVSNMSSTDLWTYYPVFDNGYGQYTNNVRYWQTPNNGKCTPPEFCGGLYNNKPIKSLNIVPIPKPISLNSEVRRVNFYGSEPMKCPDVPEPDVANCLYYGHKTNSLSPPYQPRLLNN